VKILLHLEVLIGFMKCFTEKVLPIFSIHLHGRDVALLHLIKSYFGVGTIRTNKRTGSCLYSVRSLTDLTNVIIPHFDKYPLLTQKRADFILFKSIVQLTNNDEHLTEGIGKIVSIKASMNKGINISVFKNFSSGATPPCCEAAKPRSREAEHPPLTPPSPGWGGGGGCFAGGGRGHSIASLVKSLDYADFVKIAYLMKNKAH
jgi:LAGLIDADG endonuclease